MSTALARESGQRNGTHFKPVLKSKSPLFYGQPHASRHAQPLCPGTEDLQLLLAIVRFYFSDSSGNFHGRTSSCPKRSLLNIAHEHKLRPPFLLFRVLIYFSEHRIAHNLCTLAGNSGTAREFPTGRLNPDFFFFLVKIHLSWTRNFLSDNVYNVSIFEYGNHRDVNTRIISRLYMTLHLVRFAHCKPRYLIYMYMWKWHAIRRNAFTMRYTHAFLSHK